VLLHWGLARGHVVIPKAKTPKYQVENMNVYDFKMTEEEINQISALNQNNRLCNKFEMFNKANLFA
jgi:diketogulonate reductase-like aldo/keto reductase